MGVKGCIFDVGEWAKKEDVWYGPLPADACLHIRLFFHGAGETRNDAAVGINSTWFSGALSITDIFFGRDITYAIVMRHV